MSKKKSKIKLPKNTSQCDVADNIKIIRMKQNHSIEAVAKIANLPKEWIENLETGKYLPSEKDLQILCDVFVCERKNIIRKNGYKNLTTHFKYENGINEDKIELLNKLNHCENVDVSIDDIFNCGINDIYDFWDKKYEMEGVIYSKNNGVDSCELQYTDKYDDYAEEIAVLCKWGNFYYVYGIPSMTNGYGDDYLSFEEMMTYDKEKAITHYNEISYQCVPVSEMRKKYKEMINNERIYCDYKPNVFSGYWNLKIDYNLVLEKYPEISLEEIQTAFEKYENMKNKLSEKGISIENIYKRKEYPGNQRYYMFDLYSDSCGRIVHEVHIPSKMQHKKRDVLEFLDISEIEEKYL